MSLAIAGRRGPTAADKQDVMMQQQSHRPQRVADLLREEFSTMLLREIKDPRVQCLMTVMSVEVTKDLRLARIYVSVHGDEAAREKALIGLRQAKGFIRRTLGQRIDLRRMPDLEFRLDRSLDAQERITRLLVEEGQR